MRRAAPAANGTAVPGGSPRRLSRHPFSAVAPAITGNAAWRDSRLASSRVNRRDRATASVAPLREIPGTSAHACATPSNSASAAPASVCVRSWGARSDHAIAIAPITSAAAIVGGGPKQRSIGRSSV